MMCTKLSKKCAPKHILVVSQTNIGDVVLTCPVIDILRRDFPQAKMDVVVGPKAVSLFAGNPNFALKIFDKQAPLKQNVAWFLDLYRQHYDCVVDLRRTMLSFFLMPKYATSLIEMPHDTMPVHKRDINLNRLRQVYGFDTPSSKHYAVVTTREDEQFFESQVAIFLRGKSFVVIAAGAASSNKRWYPEGFAAVADHILPNGKIVFVGDANDGEIIDDIQGRMKTPSLSLAGEITLRQLAFVLKKSVWALTHDSGVMHLASYLNVPQVVLWGPTNLDRYAPWGKKSVVVKRNEKCIRCQDPKSKDEHNCMSFIEVEDVIKAINAFQNEKKQDLP